MKPDVTDLLRGASEFLKHDSLHRLTICGERVSKPELIAMLESALIDENSYADLRASGGIAGGMELSEETKRQLDEIDRNIASAHRNAGNTYFD